MVSRRFAIRRFVVSTFCSFRRFDIRRFVFRRFVFRRFVCAPKIVTTKNFSPSDCFIIGQDFLGHALYKGPKFIIRNMDFMGIKRCRILLRFQKYKLTNKMHIKKLLKKKEFLYYTGGTLRTSENL
jgi:hypothetical protein